MHFRSGRSWLCTTPCRVITSFYIKGHWGVKTNKEQVWKKLKDHILTPGSLSLQAFLCNFTFCVHPNLVPKLCLKISVQHSRTFKVLCTNSCRKGKKSADCFFHQQMCIHLFLWRLRDALRCSNILVDWQHSGNLFASGVHDYRKT